MRRAVTVAASVLDQAAASLTNIAVLVIAARTSSAEGFAAFSMVYITFTVLLGLNMAFVGQAVVLEKGEDDRVGAAARSAVTFTAAASALAALPLLVAGALVDGAGGPAFLALGAVLPVVLVQDGLRYSFSALRQPHRALAADTLRLVCAVPALLLQPYGTSPARLVLVWGLSALPAVLLGLALLRPFVRNRPGEPRRHLRKGHLGRRFVVEYAVGSASSQLAVLGIGLFASPLAVGALRGASTLFGPLGVLLTSVNAFAPPLLGRSGSRRATVRAAAALGAVLALLALAWGTLLLALPERVGRQLLGDTWQSAADLLPATGSQYAVMALGTCALVTLRVLSPRATLSVQVVFSLLAVALMIGGYLLAGTAGAAWGLAAGSALKAVAAWTRVARTRPEPAAGQEDGRQRSAAPLS
ncbi:hypothetical protein GPZ77_29515 [Streptomyces sp. QHH-9511]|uniref:hypothetical protein n=1 Tax=Streptomyces sp. QHH-9511 TaxID=2684468 RepID=UPI001316BA4C|nr:hypothetical protein [Streptomyces sp. QHH-9511]QGZ51958.1 hypothetical protein GPZ77_29515 [Streptomyces sp. QHH-9511]